MMANDWFNENELEQEQEIVEINERAEWDKINNIVQEFVGSEADQFAFEVLGRVDYKYRAACLMVAHFMALKLGSDDAFTLIIRLASIVNEDVDVLLKDSSKVLIALNEQEKARSNKQ